MEMPFRRGPSGPFFFLLSGRTRAFPPNVSVASGLVDAPTSRPCWGRIVCTSVGPGGQEHRPQFPSSELPPWVAARLQGAYEV